MYIAHKIALDIDEGQQVYLKKAIGIEKLDVVGMVKNKRLARFVSLTGLGELRRQMRYKAELYGCTVVEADAFFPSSRICSCCGAKNDALKLSDRTWTCPACGRHHDRDRNAAKDLRDGSKECFVRSCILSPDGKYR